MQVITIGAPSEPSLLAVMLNIWAAVGPLVGIFIGTYLTQSSQRRQWIADNKVKEWRDLLGTLMTSMTTIIRCSNIAPQTSEVAVEDLRARVAAGEVINNRLFVAREVRQGNILEKWHEAVKIFDENHDPKAFGTSLGKIQFQIEQGARADIRTGFKATS
jgi:hypothetical protein